MMRFRNILYSALALCLSVPSVTLADNRCRNLSTPLLSAQDAVPFVRVHVAGYTIGKADADNNSEADKKKVRDAIDGLRCLVGPKSDPSPWQFSLKPLNKIQLSENLRSFLLLKDGSNRQAALRDLALKAGKLMCKEKALVVSLLVKPSVGSSGDQVFVMPQLIGSAAKEGLKTIPDQSALLKDGSIVPEPELESKIKQYTCQKSFDADCLALILKQAAKWARPEGTSDCGEQADVLLHQARDQVKVILEEAEQKKKQIVDDAKKEAKQNKDQILAAANDEAASIQQKAEEAGRAKHQAILGSANDQAARLVENAKKEAASLVSTACASCAAALPQSTGWWQARSAPTYVALGSLAVGFTASVLTAGLLYGRDRNDAGNLDLGSTCGPLENMHCGYVKNTLAPGVYTALGAAGAFGTGLLITWAVDYGIWRSKRR